MLSLFSFYINFFVVYVVLPYRFNPSIIFFSLSCFWLYIPHPSVYSEDEKKKKKKVSLWKIPLIDQQSHLSPQKKNPQNNPSHQFLTSNNSIHFVLQFPTHFSLLLLSKKWWNWEANDSTTLGKFWCFRFFFPLLL